MTETPPPISRRTETAPPSSPGAAALSASEVALLAGGLTLFLVLLYQMRDMLNPLLVAAAFLILVWPMRAHRAARAIKLSGSFLLLVWLLNRLSIVLLPFALAYLLAYLCDPVVAYLRRRLRVPRWLSALAVTALVVGLVAMILLMLVPTIVDQLESLAERILGSIGNLQTWMGNLAALDQLQAAGIIDKQELIGQLSGAVQDQATALASSVPNAAKAVLQSISSLFGILTVVALIPVLFFYTLKDYAAIRNRLIELFPTFDGRRDYLTEAGGLVGKYLRGQLTISAIVAIIVSAALLIFDVPFALLIGLMAGLLNMIPNLGIIITYVIGGLLALAFGGVVKLIIVVAVLVGESFLEQSVLTPNILGQKVGLHPVLILLSLFVFGYFMGMFGLIIAVPATALLVTTYQATREHWTFDLARSGEASRPPAREEAGETFPPAPRPMGGAAAPGETPDPVA